MGCFFGLECDDDLCIFVCGTCKRYFTQLSAFSQHKKENLCKKKSPGGVLLKDSIVGKHSAQETSEVNPYYPCVNYNLRL